MKTYGGVDALASALVGGSRQLHSLVTLSPGIEPPGILWIGVCVDPSAGLDNMEN
jgi:hypothetical protein